MSKTKINLFQKIKDSLPVFIKEDFPLFGELLEEYYISLEKQSGSYDILNRIDEYVKLDQLTSITESTILTINLDFSDTNIEVESTEGFPEKYGLIKINNEIIAYKEKTDRFFVDCYRGFSGVDSLDNGLNFSTTNVNLHSSSSKVYNLSALFLVEFLRKLKLQLLPGFDGITFNSNLNESIFIKQSSDFYKSKGADGSFKILFAALFGEEVKIIRPRDDVFEPSKSIYKVTNDIVVESISGNPEDCLNRTVYQISDNGEQSYGSITKVEKISRSGKDYFILSIDSDYNRDTTSRGSIFGNFEYNNNTLSIEDYSSDNTSLFVDSTIGFPNVGELYCILPDGNTEYITYNGKTINQFFGVTSVIDLPSNTRLISPNFLICNLENSDVEMRIFPILSKSLPDFNSIATEKGDKVLLSSLGSNTKNPKFNDWVFNISNRNNVSSIEVQELRQNKYRITFFENSDFYVGDLFKLYSSSGDEYNLELISRNSKLQYSFTSNKRIVNVSSPGFYTVRNIKKPDILNFDLVSEVSTNVQNIYTDSSEKSLYVASQSIPNYGNSPLEVPSNVLEFYGNYSPDVDNYDLTVLKHPFNTGDIVLYSEPEQDANGNPNTNVMSFPRGRYYVKVVDKDTIKLSSSISNIFTNNFIKFFGNIPENNKNKLYHLKYDTFDFSFLGLFSEEPTRYNKIANQNLLKLIKEPVNNSESFSETIPGTIGIFKNGVEILNYKSKDKIFYGKIKSIEILSSGENYDVINPPKLNLDDTVFGSTYGSGFDGTLEISGHLDSIDIFDGGTGFIKDPLIRISGGNGIGAKAEPVLESYSYFEEFNSGNSSSVDILNNKIIFSNTIFFINGEKVLYNSNGNNTITGLDNGIYYVRRVDDTSIQLYRNSEDALNNNNPINFTGLGSNTHTIKSFDNRKKISKITILNKGSNYTNKKLKFDSDFNSVNPYNNIITLNSHGFSTGESVRYTCLGTPIGGLTSGSDYIVRKIDDNSFKLEQNNEVVNLTSNGLGVHTIGYLPITVEVVALDNIPNNTAEIRPLFKGQIKSCWIYRNGSGYGSRDIFNFNRQPKIEIKNGSSARVRPIIINGRISSVVIENSGYDYYSVPEIVIRSESGEGAKLSAKINNGLLDDIVIEQSGINYGNDTYIEVISSGSGAKLFAKINSWTVNIVEKEFNKKLVSSDDGFIAASNSYGENISGAFKYTHLYAPRKLRSFILTKRVESGIERYVPDITFSVIEGRELDSKYHSPILGWAYDGNPIYGPYGYSNPDGTGRVKQLTSGYRIVDKQDRPSELQFPLGYFVEDYEYFDGQDLDIHNGRFCVTPEYPNGVYAYFCTIGVVDAAYQNYKKPQFPYVIGNFYRSTPIEFNFSIENQNSFDFSQVFRNTTPYNLFEENSGYDFINQGEEIINHSSLISKVSRGNISGVNIVSSGKNYKVGDTINFDNTSSQGFGVRATVSFVNGKTVSSLGYGITTIENVTLTNYNNGFVAISSEPHNLVTNKLFYYDGNDDPKNLLVKVENNKVILSNNIGNTGVTGITTYISVVGNLEYPKIIVDDILNLGSNEQVKVLEVDQESSRLRILREYNSYPGTSHTAGLVIEEDTRKFLYDVGEFSNSKNLNIYFDPEESLGIGLGVTVTLKNPGVHRKEVYIDKNRIYLRNHKLSSNTPLIYSSNGNFPIGVALSSNTFRLRDGQVVYAQRIDSDFIGITTIKSFFGVDGSQVGVGTGLNANLLSFTDYGIGDYHSFRTDIPSVKNVTINSAYIDITTTENHELKNGDEINLGAKYFNQKIVKIVYNDETRRFGIDPIIFATTDVNVTNNTITIKDHPYYHKQKVLHTSESPSVGLFSDEIYYINVVDKDTIKLSTTQSDDSIVNISTASFGTIIQINPKIQAKRNQNIVFDLSDETLSYIRNLVRYPAFEFNLYTDSNFRNKFISTKNSNSFNVIRTGRIGIDLNAQLLLRYEDDLPDILYYKLDPINDNDTPNFKYEIIIDDNDVNTVSYIDSFYNFTDRIIKLTDKSLRIYLNRPPSELVSNLTSIANVDYVTDSPNVSGSINFIDIKSFGSEFTNIPSILNINSENGIDFLGIIQSDNIGSIQQINIDKIGNDFSSDPTIRPRSNPPISLKIEPLASVEYIKPISFGKNYNGLPDLILIDGLTQKPSEDLKLRFNESTQEVDILTNTNGIYNVTPTIIPFNNTNGFKILSLDYDTAEGTATAILDTVGFSTLSAFPFTIGSKVLLENVVTENPDSDLGYNSKNYDYKLFTVTANDPNIGGQLPSVTFSMKEVLGNNHPGFYDDLFTSARIIPDSYFPEFEIKLAKNIFFKDEIVDQNGGFTGQVVKWDKNNEFLRVETRNYQDLQLNQLIKGRSSQSFGTVSSIVGISTVDYVIGPIRTKSSSWQDRKGFLNDQFQRLHDSDYYQYFSYAISSKVPSDKWDSLVQETNHTAGFKRFSNLSLISNPSAGNTTGISKDQNDGYVLGIANIDGYGDLNCHYDFDLVSENSIQIGPNEFISDEIRFNSRLLQDYFESIGNRVLIVDEIQDQFNSNPRPTRFSVVDEFKLDDFKYRKYFIHTANKLFTDDRQSIIVNLLQDKNYGWLNQYGRVETDRTHGYFDFTVFGSYGYLLYYPIDFEYEDYNISGISLNIGDQLVGLGTTSLGNVVSVASSYRTVTSGVGAGVPIQISSIPNTYRSIKYIITAESDDGSFLQADEISLVHDGTDIFVTEFAKLETSSFNRDIAVGFCTYYPQISGSNITVSLVPNYNPPQNFKINILTTQISDTSRTGIGSTALNTSLIETEFKSILGSPTPSPGIVTSIPRDYHSFYILASIEDTTNNIYQFTELVATRDNDDGYITEFGRVVTDVSVEDTGIGTFTTAINGITDEFELYFEPLANRNIELRTIIYSVELVDLLKIYKSVDLDQANISTLYGDYRGTQNDIKRSFELFYKQDPIFQRKINSQDSSIVDTIENVIVIPNHFFVTGEKIIYSYDDTAFVPDQPIGIATTAFPGIGVTDKLPSELYVIKVNDSQIRFATTAENALKYNPVSITINSVGVGTQHTFTATNKDPKCVFTVDNIIQSPVVKTGIEFELTTNLSATDNQFKLTGISSIFSKDLLQINDEIMLVETVGTTSNDYIRVRRRWMGEKGIAAHFIGDKVYKLSGNYTIYENSLDFASAPYGKVPVTQPQNQVGAPIIRPDDRDFTGITTSSYFSGRVFLRSGEVDTVDEVYTENVIFDDISQQFTGIASQFTLTVDGNDVTGISTNNGILLVRDIFQQPSRLGPSSVDGNYVLNDTGTQTIIEFTPSTQEVINDVNVTSLPSGGVILSVGSTSGFGYQPLISAGGTAIVSGFGTISSVSIGESGSGYRSGIQTFINVYAQTSTSIENIGTAAVSNGSIVSVAVTNVGTSYTNTNPPLIIFESPLGYSNIPLVYSKDSVQGIGTGAKVDLIISNNSSVLEFNIANNGYSYKEGEILTVDVGGITGIPSDISKTFREFQINIKSVYRDEFSGWTIGDLQQLDPFDGLFNGRRRVFPLKFQGNRVSIIAKNGSNIDVEATLLIFVNGILQIPGKAYSFKGGSIIIFSEPPLPEYTSNILFYRGTPNVDVTLVDIIEPVEIGDTAKIHSNNLREREDKRQIEDILSADIVITNPYNGPGKLTDEITQRPVNICRQVEDLFINGDFVSKDRAIYEPLITPSTNIIQNVSSASTDMFVESLKTFFDSGAENMSAFLSSQIELISNNPFQVAIATAIVSSAGSITSIDITNSGFGYTSIPTAVISNPPENSLNGVKAEVELILNNGSVSSYNITNTGSGYNQDNPPVILIESPNPVVEEIINVSYYGDFGTIVGISRTTVGVGYTAIALDFYIDEQSFLRNPIVNSGTQYVTGHSGISTNYYFVISNSNIGISVTSLYNDGTILGSSDNYVDGVYQVYDLEIKNKEIVGIGTTTVVEVHTRIDSELDLTLPTFDSTLVTLDSTLFTFDSNSKDYSYFGNFSWGRIGFDEVRSRRNRKDFNAYYQNGYAGLSTSTYVKRKNPLKFELYRNIV